MVKTLTLDQWTECPECGDSMTFGGSRQDNDLKCTSCRYSIDDSDEMLDVMSCPDCGSSRIKFGRSGEIFIGDKRGVEVSCENCGAVEGDVV